MSAASSICWRPTPDRIASANLTRYFDWLAQRGLPRFESMAQAHRWSVENSELFWKSIWEFCQVVAEKGWDEILIDGDKMPGAKWFAGARLNFASNLLRHAQLRPEAEALVSWNEVGPRRRFTFRELAEAVDRLSAALDAAGVRPGDRVAGFLPNLPEAVIAMLASTRLGAIWSSCSPDFGLAGVMDRFGQIEPKILFAADGYLYSGKEFDSCERVSGVAEKCPSIEKVVLVGYRLPKPGLSVVPRSVAYEEFVAPFSTKAAPPAASLPFDHPVYILYSSGTTGMPKCIVHGAGGTLVQHLKELVLHSDLKPGDRILYYTTCGWMMWNWLVSSLAVGATVVLYEGSPTAPNPDALWELAERERLTHFGASAKYLSAIEKLGVAPATTRRLDSLRMILSTGSPLPATSYDYVYRSIKSDVCLSSISGGTDIVSCFVLGDPTGLVYRGELQTRGLGMAVEVFDENGRPLLNEPGELVCTKPFPSMPIGFWNDPGAVNYRSAYFEHFPGVWRHGDWVELNDHGGMVFYGRSDAVLNPGGVRIGTAEIYRQVEQLPEIVESIVVAQDWQNDVRIVLFVRLKEGYSWSEALAEKIRQQIRANTTPRHVPAKILPVADIPRTISGKIVELAVRNVIHGKPVKNVDALANPQALELFKGLKELSE